MQALQSSYSWANGDDSDDNSDDDDVSDKEEYNSSQGDEESQLRSFSGSESSQHNEESQHSSALSSVSTNSFGPPLAQVFGPNPPQPPRVINLQRHTAMYSEVYSLTVEDILSAGLLYAGFEPARLKRNNITRRFEWFKGFYGVEPTSVVPFFRDRKDEYPDIVYKDCPMTMNWIALYDTYIVLSGRWKYCEEYIGSKVIEYGLKMSKVARGKIVFKLKDDIELGRTVDCTTFMVQEFRQDPSTSWFDYKTHSCGLKYETCLATREPQICWISGPHAASIHDITIFRGGEADEDEDDWDHNALYFQLQDGEMVVADSGYVGEPSKVVVSKDEQSSEFKEFLARAKNRQETFHWRLKSFNILGHRFRHGKSTQERMKLHKMAFELVAGIIQYDYENGHPPFDIC